MEKTTRVKAKVLVIDDEGDLSELLQIALNSDYTIEAIEDGRDALTKLGEFHPDLVVTDNYVPLQDGFDLIDEIRKVSQVPVIVVSETSLGRKMSFFEKKGVAAVMVKPFTLKDLKSKVKEALEG